MPEIVGQRRTKNAELSSEDGKISFSTTLNYIVYDESGEASEAQILTTAGLPITNEPFSIPDVPYQTACKSKKCEQWEGNKKYWDVSCEIVNTEISVWIPGTGGGGGSGGGGEGDPDDPETWTPQITLNFEQEDEVLLTDNYGLAIVNTANRRYQSPLVRKRLIPVWKFTQYESASITIDAIMERHETVNKDLYKGRPPGTWMLLVDGCDTGIRNGRRLWKISYCLKYRSRVHKKVCYRNFDGTIEGPLEAQTGWQPVLMQIDSHNKKLEPLLDKKLNYTEDFLNKDGLQLYNRANDETGDPIFLLHSIYEAISFDFLRI